MPKYMIQDIVPPERRKAKKEASETKPIRRPASEHPLEHKEKTPEPVLSKAQAAIHTSQEKEYPLASPEHKEETPHHSAEIEDLLPENPRAMILEHLYEDSPHARGPLVESHSSVSSENTATDRNAEGTWPYNNQKSDTPKIDPDRLVPPHFPHSSSGGAEHHPFKGWAPWLVMPLILIGAFVFISNFFAQTTLLVIPKSEVVKLEEELTLVAYKEPTEDSLGFSVMEVALDDSVEVMATGTRTVTAKASGTIIVYNEQTTDQRLIKNTRFQSPTGKIYRINDSIVVPKARTVSGKLTPGTLEVVVYADEAGPDYNSQPTDFTVPGLKDLPQYTQVYARSKTALSGGASGTVKIVSDQAMRAAQEQLRVSLETKLRTKARGEIAPSQVAYEKGFLIEIQDATLSTTTASEDDRAVVRATGTLYLPVFDREALARAIARSVIPTYKGEPVEITSIDALRFTLGKMSGKELWESTEISFAVSGTPEIVWKVDETVMKNAVLGREEKDFKLLFNDFRNVERVKATIRPFWKNTYPTDPKDVIVEIVREIPE